MLRRVDNPTHLGETTSIGNRSDVGSLKLKRRDDYSPAVPKATDHMELNFNGLARKLRKAQAREPQVEKVIGWAKGLHESGVITADELKSFMNVNKDKLRNLVFDLFRPNSISNAPPDRYQPTDSQREAGQRLMLAAAIKRIHANSDPLHASDATDRIDDWDESLRQELRLPNRETGKLETLHGYDVIDPKALKPGSAVFVDKDMPENWQHDPVQAKKVLEENRKLSEQYQGLSRDCRHALAQTTRAMADRGALTHGDVSQFVFDKLAPPMISELLKPSSRRNRDPGEQRLREALLTDVVAQYKQDAHNNTVMKRAHVFRAALERTYSIYDRKTGVTTTFRGDELLPGSGRTDLPPDLAKLAGSLATSDDCERLLNALRDVKRAELPPAHAKALAAMRQELVHEKKAITGDQFDKLVGKLGGRDVKMLVDPLVGWFGPSRSTKLVQQALIATIAQDLDKGFSVDEAKARAVRLRTSLEADYPSVDDKGRSIKIKGVNLLDEFATRTLPEFRGNAMSMQDRFDRDRLVQGLNDLKVMRQLHRVEEHGPKTYLNIRHELNPTDKKALFLFAGGAKNALTIKMWNDRSRYGAIRDPARRQRARDLGLAIFAKEMAQGKNADTGEIEIGLRNVDPTRLLDFYDRLPYNLDFGLEGPPKILSTRDDGQTAEEAAKAAKQKLVDAAKSNDFDKNVSGMCTQYQVEPSSFLTPTGDKAEPAMDQPPKPLTTGPGPLENDHSDQTDMVATTPGGPATIAYPKLDPSSHHPSGITPYNPNLTTEEQETYDQLMALDDLEHRHFKTNSDDEEDAAERSSDKQKQLLVDQWGGGRVPWKIIPADPKNDGVPLAPPEPNDNGPNRTGGQPSGDIGSGTPRPAQVQSAPITKPPIDASVIDAIDDVFIFLDTKVRKGRSGPSERDLHRELRPLLSELCDDTPLTLERAERIADLAIRASATLVKREREIASSGADQESVRQMAILNRGLARVAGEMTSALRHIAAAQDAKGETLAPEARPSAPVLGSGPVIGDQEWAALNNGLLLIPPDEDFRKVRDATRLLIDQLNTVRQNNLQLSKPLLALAAKAQLEIENALAAEAGKLRGSVTDARIGLNEVRAKRSENDRQLEDALTRAIWTEDRFIQEVEQPLTQLSMAIGKLATDNGAADPSGIADLDRLALSTLLFRLLNSKGVRAGDEALQDIMRRVQVITNVLQNQTIAHSKLNPAFWSMVAETRTLAADLTAKVADLDDAVLLNDVAGTLANIARSGQAGSGAVPLDPPLMAPPMRQSGQRPAFEIGPGTERAIVQAHGWALTAGNERLGKQTRDLLDTLRQNAGAVLDADKVRSIREQAAAVMTGAAIEALTVEDPQVSSAMTHLSETLGTMLAQPALADDPMDALRALLTREQAAGPGPAPFDPDDLDALQQGLLAIPQTRETAQLRETLKTLVSVGTHGTLPAAYPDLRVGQTAENCKKVVDRLLEDGKHEPIGKELEALSEALDNIATPNAEPAEDKL